jgi:hypothetical protein
MGKTRYAQLETKLKEEYAPDKRTALKLELKDRATSQDLYQELTAKTPTPGCRGMKHWGGNPVSAAEFPAIYAGYAVKNLLLELYERKSALEAVCTFPCILLSCLSACLPLCVAVCIDRTNIPTDEEKTAISSLVAALEACCVVENIVPADASLSAVVSAVPLLWGLFSAPSWTPTIPIPQSSRENDERKASVVDKQKAETKSAIEQEALKTIAAISRTSLLITNAGVKSALAAIRVHVMNSHHINFDDRRLFGSSAQATAAPERTPLLPSQPLTSRVS